MDINYTITTKDTFLSPTLGECILGLLFLDGWFLLEGGHSISCTNMYQLHIRGCIRHQCARIIPLLKNLQFVESLTLITTKSLVKVGLEIIF